MLTWAACDSVLLILCVIYWLIDKLTLKWRKKHKKCKNYFIVNRRNTKNTNIMLLLNKLNKLNFINRFTVKQQILAAAQFGRFLSKRNINCYKIWLSLMFCLSHIKAIHTGYYLMLWFFSLSQFSQFLNCQ